MEFSISALGVEGKHLGLIHMVYVTTLAQLEHGRRLEWLLSNCTYKRAWKSHRFTTNKTQAGTKAQSLLNHVHANGANFNM